MKNEKFFIVYSKYGYYVSYKDKISNNYSDNFIFAKRYKTFGAALSRAFLYDYKGVNAIRYMNKIENGESPFEDNIKIEVVRIDNLRNRKLRKLSGESSDAIRNLGQIKIEKIYDFLKKEADKFLRSTNGKYYNHVPEKTATQEDIDDFCAHMDNIKK